MHHLMKWAISLFAAASLFAQNKPSSALTQRGHEQSQDQLRNSYSASARIEVRGSWNIYARGSFIYWQARQENVEIGLISRNLPEGTPSDTPFTTSYVNNITITQPNFKYQPGFRFGLGVNLDWDDWDAYLEYTWFHSSIHSRVKPLPFTTSTAPPPNGAHLYPIQGASLTLDNLPLFFQHAKQGWSLKMDLLDLSLARNYYSGTHLTLRPFFGARGAAIRQHLNTDYMGSTNYAIAHGTFASWGIGPRAGFESNWLLGCGTHLMGNASGDILYTRYHLRQHQQITFLDEEHASQPIQSNLAVSQNIDYLRPHLNMEFGFGWGTYFDHYNWYVDFSAIYGFQIFWNQNMFRNFESVVAKSKLPNGNLYIHGLTLNIAYIF